MKPRFTDGRRRYYGSEASRAPGYLARRFEAIRRLQRMKTRAGNVSPIKKERSA